MAGEARIKLAMETASLQKSIKDSITKLEQLSNKYQELNGKLKERGPEEYAKTLEKALESNSKAIDKQKNKLDELAQKYSKYQKQYEKALANNDTQGASLAKKNMDSIDTQDVEATNELLRLESERDNIIRQTTSDYNNQTEAIKSQLNDTKQAFDSLNGIMEDDVKKVGKLSSVFSKVKATTKDIVSDVDSKLSNAFKSIFAKKDNGAMFKSMATNAKQMMMALLGAQGAFTLMSKAVSQIKEDNKELANTMNTIWNGLVQLIAPAVNMIVNAFATALNYVIKIASIITGINILGKLKQTQKKKTGGSGSSNLYSFDTSETLNKSGSGGDSTTANYMKDVELNEKLLGYAEKLKSIWSDIQKIGNNIVDRVKEGFDYMDSGTRILDTLDKFVNSFLDHIKEMSEATVKWSESINFGPLFDSFATLLEAVQPILSTLGDLIVWVYENCILPLGTYLIESLGPAIGNVIAPALTIIGAVISGLKDGLEWIWNNILQPLADEIGDKIVNTLDLVSGFLDKIGNNEKFMSYMKTLGEVVGVVVAGLTAWAAISGVVTGAIGLLSGALNFLASNPLVLVIGLIALLVAGFIEAYKTSETFRDKINSVVNAVLGFFEGLANGVIDAWNAIKHAMNTLHFDIPDWVPGIGGKSFGFNFSDTAHVSLPRLAKGAVIPPNKEFLAMLGDQTRGRNIETPEGLLREIVQEETGTQEINIVANGSLSQFIKLLRFELQREDKRVGANLVVGG